MFISTFIAVALFTGAIILAIAGKIENFKRRRAVRARFEKVMKAEGLWVA